MDIKSLVTDILLWAIILLGMFLTFCFSVSPRMTLAFLAAEATIILIAVKCC